MYNKPVINKIPFVKSIANTNQRISTKQVITQKMNTVFLSIVIPTYNRLDLLKESMNGILKQIKVDYKYEIIVICDNPKDIEISNYIRSLNLDNLSYYINTKNLGLFNTMNLGVQLAQGEWVAFLHDDDLLKENYLKEINKLIHKHKDIGAIMVSTKQIGNVNYRSRLRETGLYKFLKPIKDKLSNGKMYQLRIFDNILWCADQYGAPSCGSVWNREKFLQVGGYNDEWYPSGDWFYMVEFNKKYKVYKTSEQLGYYRWSENASTKPEVIQKFITDNLYLREYFREHYTLGKIVYHLTKKEHYRHIIDVFLTFEKTQSLKPEDYNNIYPYPKNSIRYQIYLNGQRLYWVLRVMISLVFG